MFALVRFPNEVGNKLYVVPTRYIKDFEPSDDEDFDAKAIYQAFWDDPEKESTGFYSAQILMMADTEENLEKKRASKRIRKTKVYASEYEAEEEVDDVAPSQAGARRDKQEKKVQKENKQAGRSRAYADILKEQLQSSKRKNAEAASHLQAPKMQQDTPTSDSDTDDSIIAMPSSQLELKKKDVSHWRQLYQEKCRENEKLYNIIESLQSTVDGKLCASLPSPCLAALLQILEGQAQRPCDLEPSHDHMTASCDPAAQGPSRERPTTPHFTVVASTSAATLLATPTREATVGAGTKRPLSGNKGGQRRPQSTDVADYGGPSSATPFSTLENGRFHLKGGVTISEEQRKHIYANTRPAKFAKDTAQILWGSKTLVERSYGGKLAPKDRKNLGASARKELTPEKVSLILETLTHWGRTKNVEVSGAFANMNTILSEKIQDTRKGFRRMGLMHD
ncbi:uncharacterized protein LOC115324298 isoform X2 [Ixodes scapularis]|uniref:uncharacterized protein LOC115328063 isoform X2 n=1 Tax=Ixodes scapularis TaxID=6945 RepID=UPI001161A1A0|nr:uncharacterized protein LOC115328063 isoform X2 [Ixodes scapularis]XP_040079720.1 uncharacterized protein LOC115324298 isoform X2 [Ixodes scapularis]